MSLHVTNIYAIPFSIPDPEFVLWKFEAMAPVWQALLDLVTCGSSDPSKVHWSCSCKENRGSFNLLGKMPWVQEASDSSDEDTSSLEWKPTVLCADGSRYTGQWKGNVWQGEGQLERADGSTYEGCFKDGKPHGTGCLKGADGSIYQGQWRQGRAHGMGKYTKAGGGCYEGQWLEDKRAGLGTELWADGCLYRGSFQNGCKHGRGFYQTPQGASYNGSFQADQMHGEGVYKFPDGRVYSGSFKSGQMTGYGLMFWPSGAAYEGQYLDGEKTVQESTHGQMVVSMKGNGPMDKCMAKESCTVSIALPRVALGVMVLGQRLDWSFHKWSLVMKCTLVALMAFCMMSINAIARWELYPCSSNKRPAGWCQILTWQ